MDTTGIIGSTKLIVAGSSDGDGLDDGTASDEVKDLPDDGAGPEKVAGEGLALGQTALESPLLILSRVVKVQERDVGQLEVGQVGEDRVRELDLFLGEVVSRHDLAGLVDVARVGS